VYDLFSYLFEGIDVVDWYDYVVVKFEEFIDCVWVLMVKYVEVMVGFMDVGVEVFDYGNLICDEVCFGGFDCVFVFFGFVFVYIWLLFCEGKGLFCWVVLSGDLKDIVVIDCVVFDLFFDNDYLYCWICVV